MDRAHGPLQIKHTLQHLRQDHRVERALGNPHTGLQIADNRCDGIPLNHHEHIRVRDLRAPVTTGVFVARDLKHATSDAPGL